MTAIASAQATQPSVAPTVIPVSGELRTPTGEPRRGTVVLVISLYDGREDQAPRWIEYQTVNVGADGRFSISFGGTREEGLPAELFANAPSARWVGVSVENETEQPRTMLLSVPYAAKAASADTLAGKPASEFVLASNFKSDVEAVLQDTSVAAGNASAEATSPDPPLLLSGASSNMYISWRPDGVQKIVMGTARAVKGTLDAGDHLSFFAETGLGIQFMVNGSASESARFNPDGSFELTKNRFSIVAPTANNFFWFRPNGVSKALVGMAGAIKGNSSTDLGFFAETGSGVTFMVNGSANDALTIAASGNVGVGTAAPTAKLHIAGDVVVDGNIGAKYQDVAEWVESAEPIEAGSVVVIDTAATNRVTASTRSYDGRVAGAVSAQPGLILGERGADKVLVAQSGRVKVKADARFGAIKPGDLVVTSPTKGHVMKSKPVKIGDALVHRPGTLVGKALEALPKGQGEILVLLTLQ